MINSEIDQYWIYTFINCENNIVLSNIGDMEVTTQSGTVSIGSTVCVRVKGCSDDGLAGFNCQWYVRKGEKRNETIPIKEETNLQ